MLVLFINFIGVIYCLVTHLCWFDKRPRVRARTLIALDILMLNKMKDVLYKHVYNFRLSRKKVKSL